MDFAAAAAKSRVGRALMAGSKSSSLVPAACATRLQPSRGASTEASLAAPYDPVAGAPVFLEPYDEITRKRIVDVRTVIKAIHPSASFSLRDLSRHLSPGEHVRVPDA